MRRRSLTSSGAWRFWRSSSSSLSMYMSIEVSPTTVTRLMTSSSSSSLRMEKTSLNENPVNPRIAVNDAGPDALRNWRITRRLLAVGRHEHVGVLVVGKPDLPADEPAVADLLALAPVPPVVDVEFLHAVEDV